MNPNFDGNLVGFKVTGDAAWTSDSHDFAMFSSEGNGQVWMMVEEARNLVGRCDEAVVTDLLRWREKRIAVHHKEIHDTMVRETIAYALDEAWLVAYGHHFDQWSLVHGD